MGRDKQRSGNEEHRVSREGHRAPHRHLCSPGHAHLAGNFGSGTDRGGDVLTELQQKLGQEGQRWWHHELDCHSARPLGDATQERVNSSDTLLSGAVTGTGKNNSRP